MKALVKAKREVGLWMEDVPEPKIGPKDVLVKVKKTAICGTDLHIYKWDAWSQRTIKTPMTIGHEFVGEIVELGNEVDDWNVGERVSAEGHIVCGECRACKAGKRNLCPNTVGIGVNRTGCFAEYVSIPETNLWRVHPSVSDEIASIFDPYGNATHAALSFDMVGEDVLITGAGPIGCMAAAICRHNGARNVVVTDVNDYRLTLAQRLGADRVVNVGRESLKDTMDDLGMTGRLRRGPRDVGQPPGFRPDARQHVQRRAHSPPRPHTERHRDRLGQGHLQGPLHQGHLRPRDIRDLVQDGGDDTLTPRYQPRHHPPLRLRRFPERLRRYVVRRVGQSSA